MLLQIMMSRIYQVASQSKSWTFEWCASKVKGARGTLPYMAPEALLQYRHAQLSGRMPDYGYQLDKCACDRFALGLVAYQFLAERFPFPELVTPQEYHYFLMLEDCTHLRSWLGPIRTGR